MAADIRNRINKPVCGVSVLCQDPEGNIIGDRYISDRSDLRERQYIHKLKGEKWGFVLTEVVRKYPFPEVPGFVPEGLVWLAVAKDYDDLTVNEPLRVYHAGEPDALSRRGFMGQTRGDWVVWLVFLGLTVLGVVFSVLVSQ